MLSITFTFHKCFLVSAIAFFQADDPWFDILPHGMALLLDDPQVTVHQVIKVLLHAHDRAQRDALAALEILDQGVPAKTQVKVYTFARPDRPIWACLNPRLSTSFAHLLVQCSCI